jgi:hypothetical protein
MPLLSVPGALVVALGLSACGGSGETTTATTTATTTTTVESGTTGEGGAAAAAGGSAFIDKTTGEHTGLAPDKRQGTTPPPPESTSLDQAAKAAGCELQLDLPDEGNQHIPASKTPDYDTEPPTSGPHDATPLADGAYLDAPEERFFVHSMEHGRVVIQYQPDLPEDDQLALKGILEEDPDGMILIPNPDMPYEVAATAWRNLLGCDAYDDGVLDAIRSFRDELRGKGPERIPL